MMLYASTTILWTMIDRILSLLGPVIYEYEIDLNFGKPVSVNIPFHGSVKGFKVLFYFEHSRNRYNGDITLTAMNKSTTIKLAQKHLRVEKPASNYVVHTRKGRKVYSSWPRGMWFFESNPVRLSYCRPISVDSVIMELDLKQNYIGTNAEKLFPKDTNETCLIVIRKCRFGPAALRNAHQIIP
jgi:hypothetical protein